MPDNVDKMLAEITRLTHKPLIPVDCFLDGLFEQYKRPISGVVECMNCYRFLYSLVLLYKPSIALELGVQYGLASAHMASAAKKYGGYVIGVDHGYHHVPGRLIDKTYGNYNYILGKILAVPTLLCMKYFVEKYGPIGVVFQDSSHHYAESIKEWEAYMPMLSENAIWVCDDITPAFHDPKVDPPGKGMVQYFEGLPGEKMLFPDILHKGNTIGVVVL